MLQFFRMVCLGLVALLATFQSGGVSFANGPPNALDYFGVAAKRAPNLSPSGRYVSMIWRQGGQFFIGIADLTGQEKVQFFSAGKNTYVRSTDWLTDDRLIARYTEIEKIEGLIFHTTGSTRSAAFNRDGSNPVVLFSGNRRLTKNNRNLVTVSHYLPNDPDHILMPARRGDRFNLYRINIHSGEEQLIEKGSDQTIHWVADKDGDPQMRIDLSDRGTFLYFYKIDADSGNWKRFKTIKYRDLATIEHWPIAFGPEKYTQYVLARPEGENTFSIYLYDLETEGYITKLISHPKYDIAGPILSNQDSTLLGGTYYDDRFQITSTSSQVQDEFEWVNRQFNNQANISMYSMNDRHSKALLLVTSPKIAGDYYILDREKKAISALFKTRPTLTNQNLGDMEIVNFAARDGFPLTAYVTHPVGKRGTKSPLVVMPHGGPEARDYYDYHDMSQFLASRGYRVVQTNFRGSGGFGRAFAEAGHGEWGGKMQDDITDSVQMLIDKGLAAKKNICIVGGSYGGYAALYGAIQSPELYSCAVSIAGVSNLIQMLNEEKRDWGEGSEAYGYWRRSAGDPILDREKLESKSPALRANEVQIPILLVHGEDDYVVRFSHSTNMEKALKKNAKRVEFIEIEEEGHSDWNDDKTLILFNALEKFLGEHLKN